MQIYILEIQYFNRAINKKMGDVTLNFEWAVVCEI